MVFARLCKEIEKENHKPYDRGSDKENTNHNYETIRQNEFHNTIYFLASSGKHDVDRIDIPYAVVAKNQYFPEFLKNIKEEDYNQNEAQDNEESHGCYGESFNKGGRKRYVQKNRKKIELKNSINI